MKFILWASNVEGKTELKWRTSMISSKPSCVIISDNIRIIYEIMCRKKIPKKIPLYERSSLFHLRELLTTF